MEKLFIHALVLFFYFLMSSCSSSANQADSASQSASSTLDVGALGTVTDIQAVASKMTDGSGNWQVILSWTNPPSAPALTYTIERSEKTTAVPTKTRKDDYQNITSPYTITNLPAESTQYFVVFVTGMVNNASVSVRSTEYSVKIPLDTYTQKPGPFTMTALAIDGQAKIEWTDSERASFYLIQRGTTSKSYPTVVSRLSSSPYTDSGLTNGQTYYYIVIAVNSIGSTNATDEAIAKPLGTPGTFTLTAIPGTSKITLNWTSSINAENYSILRSTTSETAGFTKLTDIAAPTLSYEDPTAVNNTLYYYKIVASSGTPPVETNSNTVNATPAALPQDFTVTATPGDSQVTLSWTDSVGASSYTVEYGTSTGSYPALVSNSATSGIMIPSLTNGTPYYFRVIAVNSIGSTNAPEVQAAPASATIYHSAWNGTRQIGISTLDSREQGWPAAMVKGPDDTTYIAGTMDTGGPAGELYLSPYQFFLTKIDDRTGRVLWTRFSSTPELEQEVLPLDMVLDQNGNIYVLIQSQSSVFNGVSINNQRIVAKFNSQGRYIRLLAIGTSTSFHKMVTDGQKIYLIGEQLYAATMKVINISTFSLEQTSYYWDNNAFGLTPNTQTRGLQIGILSNGKLVIGGSLWVNLNDGPYNFISSRPFIAIFNKNNNTFEQVTTLFDQTTHEHTYAEFNDLIIDSSDNIYITGSVTDGRDDLHRTLPGESIVGDADSYIAKFSSTGTKLWNRQFGELGKTAEGYTSKIGLYNSAGGTPLLLSFSSAYDVNNSYSRSIILGIYDVDGNLSSTTFDKTKLNENLTTSNSAYFYGVGQDGDSFRVLMQGSSDNAFGKNGYTFGYYNYTLGGFNEHLVRNFQMGSSGPYTSNIEIKSTALSESGELYAVGTTSGGINGQIFKKSNNDTFLMQHIDGLREWTAQIEGSATTVPSAVSVTRNGNFVYIAGTPGTKYDGTSISDGRIFISQFNKSPNNIYEQNHSSFITTIIDAVGLASEIVVEDMDIDDQNNLYIVGHAKGNFIDGSPPASFQTCFLTKVSTDLSIYPLWTKRIGISTAETGCKSVTVKGSSVFVSGEASTTGIKDLGSNSTFQGTVGSVGELFIAKYETDTGNFNWGINYGPQTSSLDDELYHTGMDVDNSGNIYLSGYIDSPQFNALPLASFDGTGITNAFVAKFNSTNGALSWTTQIGSTTGGIINSYSASNLLKTGPGGIVYVAGSTSGAIHDPSTNQNTSMAQNGQALAFLAKLNTSNGTISWVKSYGGRISRASYYGETTPWALSVDTFGACYLSGNHHNDTTTTGIPFGLDDNFQYGQTDGFIAKFNSAGAVQNP